MTALSGRLVGTSDSLIDATVVCAQECAHISELKPWSRTMFRIRSRFPPLLRTVVDAPPLEFPFAGFQLR